MKQNKILALAGFLTAGLLVAGVALAHVVVSPASVGVGSFQVYTLAVPTEKSLPTVAVRLIIPDGLKFVTPNVRASWKIQVKTQATGKKIIDDDGMQVDEMKPVEIDWTGGSIPPGQREEFKFQAQAPANATTLPWKAYQTYSDGSVVAWDEAPSSTAKNPFSITKVVDDLAMSSGDKVSWWQANQVNLSLGISLFALLISLGILVNHKHEN